MSFGHSGIDWLHSLLDCNRQILIIPELSFYRYWKILDCDKVEKEDEMTSLWINHFNSKSRQSPDVRLFHTENEKTKFVREFINAVQKYGLTKREVFKSIHRAYISTKKINIAEIKTIVAHEHVSFPYKEIIKDFESSKFLIIIRDPRASIAGYFKGIERKVGHLPDYHDYFINSSIEEWFNTRDIWRHNDLPSNRIRMIKNEELVKNLEKEMKGLACWLEIEFTDGLLERTFSDGSTPFVDSNYLQQSSSLERDYFSTDNIQKRWMSVLSDEREILMIESLFEDLMLRFEYKAINKISILKKIQGVYYFLIPHRGPNRLGFYKPEESEYKRFSNRLSLMSRHKYVFLFTLLPTKIKYWFILFNSFMNHFVIYFFPGNRWKRYDNPLLEKTYRNY
jgi:hypothetical protein